MGSQLCQDRCGANSAGCMSFTWHTALLQCRLCLMCLMHDAIWAVLCLQIVSLYDPLRCIPRPARRKCCLNLVDLCWHLHVDPCMKCCSLCLMQPDANCCGHARLALIVSLIQNMVIVLGKASLNCKCSAKGQCPASRDPWSKSLPLLGPNDLLAAYVSWVCIS